jgi:hypothetical protein
MSGRNEYSVKERNELFENIVLTTPGAKRTKNGVLVPLDEKGSFYHITDIYKLNTPERDEFGDKWFEYRIICDVEDLRRILNPKTLEDHLLQLRAEAILDNMRAIRVFKRRFNNGLGMTLSKWYKNKDRLNLYIDNVSKGNLERIKRVPTGTALIHQANAMCRPIGKGSIIVVSEKLMYALYFFNIFIYGESLGFEQEECFNAYVIALRTYYGHETIDFDLDPRGIFPDNTEETLQKLTTDQYNFILGHEYAHHLLGHLDNSKIVSERLLNSAGDFVPSYQYQYRYKEEYDADLYAIKNIKGNNNYRDELTNAAFSCFYFFHVLEKVGEYFSPQGNSKAKSHPPALERINHLRKRLKSTYGIDKEYISKVLESVNQVTDHFIKEMLPYHVDEFETYGSHYFKRFKPIIMQDRFDY